MPKIYFHFFYIGWLSIEMIIFLRVTRMDVVHCIILNYYHQMKNDFINNDFHLDILSCNILQ